MIYVIISKIGICGHFDSLEIAQKQIKKLHTDSISRGYPVCEYKIIEFKTHKEYEDSIVVRGKW